MVLVERAASVFSVEGPRFSLLHVPIGSLKASSLAYIRITFSTLSAT
jgi:hypothetical protein